MRGTVAKVIRQQVWGKGTHPGPLKYFRRDPNFGNAVVADRDRQNYQLAKRAYLQTETTLSPKALSHIILSYEKWARRVARDKERFLHPKRGKVRLHGKGRYDKTTQST